MTKILSRFFVSILLLTSTIFAQSLNKEDIPITDNISVAIGISKETNRPILLIFSADWCKYCQFLKDDLSQFENINKFVVCVINSDEQKSLYKEMGVRNLPTSIILDNKDHQEKSRKIGYLKKEYEHWLFSNLSQ